ncbi:BTB/POZ domain-containing protein 9 [Galendromus occidentalis]|uniref:BTB/POZ domain-containing protein 9 n=1 Tax=Galendromus occidentalis TaxID=34638 RepID=A0AAJ6VYU5_9ACAR|nr:BTB/POZ domain-containing protein 9 [Galendromus occidentalis]
MYLPPGSSRWLEKRCDETDAADDLAERIGSLLLDDRFSDISLIVEGEALPAHRIILACSCEYFRALLFGDLEESRKTQIVLEDVPLRGMKIFLTYVYTAKLDLKELEAATALEVIGIAHMYGLEKLLRKLSDFLKRNLSVESACSILERAELLELDSLSEACRDYMGHHASAILKTREFCHLPAKTLSRLLSRDTFCVEEVEIVIAIKLWREMNPDHGNFPEILEVVRLSLISTADLVTIVQDSGLFSAERLLEVIRGKEIDRIDPRGKLIKRRHPAPANHRVFTLT